MERRAYLLPNPKATHPGSSHFSSFFICPLPSRKRSGMNNSGEGYVCGSCSMDLNIIFTVSTLTVAGECVIRFDEARRI